MADTSTSTAAVVAPLMPFRVRITQPGNSPPWLRNGTGERLLYTFGLMIDIRTERLREGMLAHMPLRSATGNIAPVDALAVIATDRVITPGATETPGSLATREQRAFDDWQLAGLARGVLAPTLGALLASTPEARTVSSTFNPSTYPPTRVSSSWATYAAGASLTSAPVVTYGLASGNGDLDWDSVSPITGSWGSWSAYVIVYSVAPNDWAGAPQNWGQGSTYTPSADGYYSTVGTVGGIPAGVPSGSYTGTTRAWGAGSTYQGSGYYSTVGAYYGAPAGVPTGSYQGAANGWGVAALFTVGTSLAVTISQRKPANVWVRSIIVSRSSSLFDPAQPADGTHNPAGTFGQWSTMGTIGGLPAGVASRFSAAVYGGEVR